MSTWFILTGELFSDFLIYGHTKDNSATPIAMPQMPTVLSPQNHQLPYNFQRVSNEMSHSTKSLLMTANGLYGIGT